MKLEIKKMYCNKTVAIYTKDSNEIDDIFLYNLHKDDTVIFMQEELYEKLNKTDKKTFGEKLTDEMTLDEMIGKNLLTITTEDSQVHLEIIEYYRIYTGKEIKYLLIKE